MQSGYENLLARAKEISLIQGAASLLSWDQETGMPPKGLGFRAEQLALLDGRAHRLWTDLEVGRWLDSASEHGFAADSAEFSNLREWRRTYRRATCIPSGLIEEFSRTKSMAREAWIDAREQSDFERFKPLLGRIVEINRQMADLWGYRESPYDALLEEFEPGATVRELGPLLEGVGRGVSQLLRSYRPIETISLEGDYPISTQQQLNRRVAEAIGFDFEAGRIDTTTHPFCSGIGPGDVRLTTRYNERDFTQSLYGILHEAGHGLYEQGLPPEAFGTPLGMATSLGIHESQSRLWENHIGRSLEFWECWMPAVAEYFPSLAKYEPGQVCRAVNKVKRSFIRVEADEVTYDLHIVLRFEIERALIEGRMKTADLPSMWNARFEELLGLKVPDDAHGCLQDIHWSLGSFGYFPTYTIGNLNAAQLFHRANLDLGNLRQDLRCGNYSPLLGWLRNHVHIHGQRYTASDLIERATGERTQTKYHEAHLQSKCR